MFKLANIPRIHKQNAAASYFLPILFFLKLITRFKMSSKWPRQLCMTYAISVGSTESTASKISFGFSKSKKAQLIAANKGKTR